MKVMGDEVCDVNAEYAWQDHSWYAILSSFFFLHLSSYFYAPSSVPSSPFSLVSCSWLNFNAEINKLGRS